MRVAAIIAAGGSGRRLGAEMPKQLLPLGGRLMLHHSVEAFLRHPRISTVVLALPQDLLTQLAMEQQWRTATPPRLVAGGARRQDSVANAFEAVPEDTEIVLVHDAARPFVSEDVVSRVIDGAAETGAAIAAVPVTDTVKQTTMDGARRVITGTIPRETVFLAQTPQGFRRAVLAEAIALGRAGTEATDEAALAERAGHEVVVVDGDPANMKITTAEDLAFARRRVDERAVSRVGTGYDLHRLVEGRALIIGGVHIEAPLGAMGHSDADVACHAVTDAVLGAACLGNIGQLFPDSDPRWKGASSAALLRSAVEHVNSAGHRIINVDVSVVLERPKIAPYLGRIRAGLAEALGIPVECVSVKGKTNEGVDAVGRGEAIAAHAVALVTSYPQG